MKLRKPKKVIFSQPAHEADRLGIAYDDLKQAEKHNKDTMQDVKERIITYAKEEGTTKGKRRTVCGEACEVGYVTVTKTSFNEANLLKAVGRKLFDAMRRPVTTYIFDQAQIKKLIQDGKVKTSTLKNCLEIENSERVYVKPVKGGTEDEAQEEISGLFGL